MEPPAITRYRRPFLAPLYLGLLAAAVFFALGWALYSTATTTVVFLVRPVEKNPGTIDDPPLPPEGEARAERLAHTFGEEVSGAGRLDGIYESEDRRAEQTAAPLVERLHRSPVVFPGAQARATADRALREHAGGTVLIIASGAALPQMIEELAGISLTGTAVSDVDVVYVVSVPRFGRAHLARFRL